MSTANTTVLKREVTGNLIKLADNGRYDMIIHGCNCWNTMGAGIAKDIKIRWPAALRADKKTRRGDIRKLGTYSTAQVQRLVGHDLIIVNAYTQYHFVCGHENKPVDYDAIDKVFELIESRWRAMRIGIPLIGAGLAGGDWDKIREIILKHEGFNQIQIVNYDGS